MPLERAPEEAAAIGVPASRPTPSRTKLGIGLRVRMRARHTVLLGREVMHHGIAERMWWLLPIFVVLILVAAAITTTTTALPVAVYTLF